jgi:hypothetical protein
VVDARRQAVEAVAARWKDLSIPFLVVHGLEAYPEAIGRDLDILMDQRLADTALIEAAAVLRDLGWSAVRPPDLWGKRLVGLGEDDHGGSPRYVELHTVSALTWAVLALADRREPATASLGAVPMSRWATFAKAVLLPLLAGTFTKLEAPALERLQRSGVAGPELADRVKGELGPSIGGELMHAYESRDTYALVELASRLRLACARRALRQPVTSLFRLGSLLRKRLRRFRSMTGMRVTVVIPSDIQSDQLVAETVERLKHVFLPIEVGPPARPWRRVAQRYAVLCRQGLVEEVVTGQPEGSRISVRARLASGRSAARTFEVQPGEEVQAAQAMASWMLSQWVIDMGEHGERWRA